MRRSLAALLLGLGLWTGLAAPSPVRAGVEGDGRSNSADVRSIQRPGGDRASRDEQAAYCRRETASAGLEEFRGGSQGFGAVGAVVLVGFAGGVIIVGYLLYKGIEWVVSSHSTEE